MKCPMIFQIIQQTNSQTLFTDDDTPCGSQNFFAEFQGFGDCYGEECMAYDKENKCCRRLENEQRRT